MRRLSTACLRATTATTLRFVSQGGDLDPDHYKCGPQRGRWPTPLEPRFPPKAKELVNVEGLPADIPQAQRQLRDVLIFERDDRSPWLITDPNDISGRAPRFVRHAERASWDILEHLIETTMESPRHCGLLLGGHPGVGKSLSLDLYLRWALHTYAARGLLVLVLHTKGADVFVPSGNGEGARYFVRKHQWDAVLAPILESLRPSEPKNGKPPLLVLHDHAARGTLDYRGSLMDDLRETYAVVCVLASSPTRENYARFEKDSGVSTVPVYTNVFSKREAAAFFVWCVAPSLKYGGDSPLRVTSWKEAFEESYEWMGGVPRRLVKYASDWSEKAAPAYRDGLINEMKQSARTMKFNPACLGGDEHPHRMVQRMQSGDSKGSYYDFVSVQACVLWTQTHEWAEILHIFKALHYWNPQQGRSHLAYLLERAIAKSLQYGQGSPLHKAKCEPLPPPDKRALQQFTINLEPFGQKENRRLLGKSEKLILSELSLPTVLTFQDESFPLVDAVLVRPQAEGVHMDVTLIQVTIAPEHHASEGAVKQFHARLQLGAPATVRMVYATHAESKLERWQRLEPPQKEGQQATGKGQQATGNDWALGQCDQYVFRLSEEYDPASHLHGSTVPPAIAPGDGGNGKT